MHRIILINRRKIVKSDTTLDFTNIQSKKANNKSTNVVILLAKDGFGTKVKKEYFKSTKEVKLGSKDKGMNTFQIEKAAYAVIKVGENI